MKTQNDNLFKFSSIAEVDDTLTALLREGAKKMLASAIEFEVQDHLSLHAEIRDTKGRRLVVRNGYLPARTLQTGLGDVDVKVPRIRDNSGQSIAFHSSILPP